jgi:hypothetical protein
MHESIEQLKTFKLSHALTPHEHKLWAFLLQCALKQNDNLSKEYSVALEAIFNAEICGDEDELKALLSQLMVSVHFQGEFFFLFDSMHIKSYCHPEEAQDLGPYLFYRYTKKYFAPHFGKTEVSG